MNTEHENDDLYLTLGSRDDGEGAINVRLRLTRGQLAAYRSGGFTPSILPGSPDEMHGPDDDGVPSVTYDVRDQPTYNPEDDDHA